MKLIAKLHAIMAETGNLEKTGHNTFSKYDYATESDILNILKPLFIKHGIFLTHSVEEVKQSAHTSAKGNPEIMYEVKVSYTFIDMNDYIFVPMGNDKKQYTESIQGEKLTLYAYGTGIDSGDKGLYKALTGAHKYFLSKNFNLSTNDDPEKDDHHKTHKDHPPHFKDSVYRPTEESISYDPNFLVPLGKNKGKKISEVSPAELLSSANWIKDKAHKGEPISSVFKHFLEQVDFIPNSLEEDIKF